MLQSLAHRPYRLPLRGSLRVGGTELTERTGLVLELRDADGRVGHGEVAPLPGLHAETAADVIAEVPKLERLLHGADIAGPTALHTLLDAHGVARAPSLRFGLEMALLSLEATRRGIDLAHVLAAQPRATVAISGLFDGDLAQARAATERGTLREHEVVKVKVGRRDDERAILDHLLAELPDARLRLDGNRSLTLADARTLVEGVDAGRIEYFEDPLEDPTVLPALHGWTGIPVALDETARDPRLGTLSRAECVTAWVVKPSCAGSLARVVALAREAAETGIGCVVSSSFESGLGLWALAALAASLPGPALAAGIGTDAWLVGDVVSPPFSSARGQVALADAIGAPPDEASASS